MGDLGGLRGVPEGAPDVTGSSWSSTLVTVYTVVATANHYFLDAVGGLVVFLVALFLARLLASATAAARTRR